MVDSDLRRPVLHEIFELPSNYGLTDANVQPNPAVAEHLQPSKVENLTVLTGGKLPPNPADLLGSYRMESLVDEQKGAADVALLDNPPSPVVTDAAILGTKVDGTLAVYDADRTRRGEAERTAQKPRRVDTHLPGAVLNRLSGRRRGYYCCYRYLSYETGDGGRGRWRRRRRDHAGRRGRLFGRSREPALESQVPTTQASAGYGLRRVQASSPRGCVLWP